MGTFIPTDILDYITVVPVPLSERVEQLMAIVSSSNLPRSRIQSLLASLDAAQASLERNNIRAAINQLETFKNKVRAQVERTYDAPADQLSTAAQEIIEKAAVQLANQ